MSNGHRPVTPEFERFCACLNHYEVDYIVVGSDDLVRNKRAAGRPKDLADVAALGGAPGSSATDP